MFQAEYGSVPSGTCRSYKYKNKDTGLRLQNTVEINKTTTSLTTVDWGISNAKKTTTTAYKVASIERTSSLHYGING